MRVTFDGWRQGVEVVCSKTGHAQATSQGFGRDESVEDQIGRLIRSIGYLVVCSSNITCFTFL